MINDKIVDEIQETLDNDTRIVSEFSSKNIIDPLLEEIMKHEEFNIKHGFLSLAKAMVFLTRTYYNTDEEFDSDYKKAQDVAINRIINSITPKVENGEIVEENYDLENLSIRRLMLAFASSIDYTFWKLEVNSYIDRANNKLESENAINK